MYYTALVESKFREKLLKCYNENGREFDAFTLFSFFSSIGFMASKKCQIISEKIHCLGGNSCELLDLHFYPFKKRQFKKLIKYLENNNRKSDFIEFGLDWIRFNKEFEIKFT
jgi:hypothetical protein